MRQKMQTVFRVLFTALSVLMTAFIFGNSLQTADVSGAESGRVVELLNEWLGVLRIDASVTEQMVRKTAHFAEFFLLGALLFAMFLSYAEKPGPSLPLSLGSGLLIAAADEFLQIFSDGRSAELRDVLLDFFGVLCAVLLFTLIVLQRARKLQKKEKINIE